MDRIRLEARAKLNLSLNVLPETGQHGYYRVLFLNVQAALADSVELERLPEPGFAINAESVDGKENIALKAARLMFVEYGLPGGLAITLEKAIPSRAGLGGGSSDAAAVINGINDLFGLSLALEQRVRLAQGLGMDVCYCVVGGVCTVEGVGDVITPHPYPSPALDLLIATPPVRKPSTAWAYSVLDPSSIGRSLAKLDGLMEGIRERDPVGIARGLHNDFQAPVERHYPVTREIRERMRVKGALGVILAGSGLSVFGIFESEGACRSVKEELEGEGVECSATRIAGA